MTAQYAKIELKWVVWMQILNLFRLFKLSEIFIILLRNINTLKLAKKNKNDF